MRRLALALALLATPAAAQEFRVAAVSAPLADFARTLGGPATAVSFPVPEGADPSLWRPGIAEIGEIQGADLILLNGADFARWTARASLPRARTVVTTAGVEDRYIVTEGGVTHSHGPDGEHSHDGIAPLTWLDFSIAETQMNAVANALLAKLPEEAEGIAGRAEDLGAELQGLHQRAATLGARVAEAGAVALHPGYEYFARAYGIELPDVGLDPTSPPAPDAIAALRTLVAERTPGIVMVQAEPHPETAEVLKELGLEIVVFDPGANTAEGFVDLMTRNLDALEAATGG